MPMPTRKYQEPTIVYCVTVPPWEGTEVSNPQGGVWKSTLKAQQHSCWGKKGEQAALSATLPLLSHVTHKETIT